MLHTEKRLRLTDRKAHSVRYFNIEAGPPDLVLGEVVQEIYSIDGETKSGDGGLPPSIYGIRVMLMVNASATRTGRMITNAMRLSTSPAASPTRFSTAITGLM